MTQLETINFLNGFNPTSAALTTEQLGTLTSGHGQPALRECA